MPQIRFLNDFFHKKYLREAETYKKEYKLIANNKLNKKCRLIVDSHYLLRISVTQDDPVRGSLRKITVLNIKRRG